MEAGLDVDTICYGTDGPFETWEGDHTALVHILWRARHRGLNATADAEQISSMIEQSRFLAAARHFEATLPRTTEAAVSLADVIRSAATGLAEPLAGGADRLASAIRDSAWMRDAASVRHDAPAGAWE